VARPSSCAFPPETIGVSTAQMHSDSAPAPEQAKELLCPVDGTPFVPKRPWQKWCSTECRNKYHQSMTPVALRRDIDALRSQLAAMAETLDRVNRDADRRDTDITTGT
jgi:hypothetical protein